MYVVSCTRPGADDAAPLPCGNGRLNADVEDLEVNRSGGNLHVDPVALLVAQQRFGDRRADGQLALAQVGFVLGDDGRRL